MLKKVAVLVACTLVWGCAGLLPQFLVKPLANLDPLTIAKISDDYLDAIGNAEFEACFSLTVDEAHAKFGFDAVLLGHCTSPVAALIGLTDARHKKINSALARAYDTHKALAIDVQTWTSGMPVPTSVATFKAAVDEAVGFSGLLTPSSNPFVTALASAGSKAVSAALSMFKAVGGK